MQRPSLTEEAVSSNKIKETTGRSITGPELITSLHACLTAASSGIPAGVVSGTADNFFHGTSSHCQPINLMAIAASRPYRSLGRRLYCQLRAPAARWRSGTTHLNSPVFASDCGLDDRNDAMPFHGCFRCLLLAISAFPVKKVCSTEIADNNSNNQRDISDELLLCVKSACYYARIG